MSDLYDTFFGPLGQEYCVPFLVLVVIPLFNVFLVGYAAIRNVFAAKSKDKFNSMFVGLAAILVVFVNYIFSRVMYTMCMKSL